MSRPWRDEVAIALAPRGVALARRTRGLRPRLVAETELAVNGNDADDLAPAVARLSDALADRAWHGAVARTVVADPWARFAVVPWPRTRLDAAGRLAHARFVLGDTYGEGVAAWAVTLADTAPGHPIVACAMPPALREALEGTLAPARLRLVSLQPRLVAAFNRWRRRLPPDDAWFVSVDESSLSAVHLSHGAWDRIHTARLSADWGVELERLQAVGGLGDGGGRLFVDAPERMRRGAAAADGIEWLAADDRGGAAERGRGRNHEGG